MEETLTYLGEELIKCPNCGGLTLKVKIYVYNAPLIGRLLIEHGHCSSCNFIRNDIATLEFENPKIIKVHVKSIEDLNALVVKSATASITIPELGIEIHPGIASYGYVTTIEGILERVLDVMPVDCVEREECIREYEAVKEAMNGKKSFTLIIKDPMGRSTVIGDNLNVEFEEVHEDSIQS